MAAIALLALGFGLTVTMVCTVDGVLLRGLPYRDIHALTGVSVTTIGRVARTLERGAGGYAAAARESAPAPESV